MQAEYINLIGVWNCIPKMKHSHQRHFSRERNCEWQKGESICIPKAFRLMVLEWMKRMKSCEIFQRRLHTILLTRAVLGEPCADGDSRASIVCAASIR